MRLNAPNVLITVSTVKVTVVLNVIQHISLISMGCVSKTVEMVTTLMRNLVFVLYVMILVLYVMEETAPNVQRVLMDTTHQWVEMAVMNATLAANFVTLRMFVPIAMTTIS